MDHVVTVFVRHRGRVLLVRRSDEVGTYPGKWAGVSGDVEGDPDLARPDAERELAEEVGIHDSTLVREGEPLHVVDTDDTADDVDAGDRATRADREWVVHPFLFAVADPAIEPNWEVAAHEWVHPTAILERDCVPRLWATYRRVGSTFETVAGDDTHGSAHVAARALEALRDAAGEAAHVPDLEDPEFRSAADVAALARELRDARPAMAAVSNRVNRAMARADPGDPEGVAEAAASVLDATLDVDEAAAGAAATLLVDLAAGDPARVVTLSRSGTTLAALREAEPAVVVGESRPGREGVAVSEDLADDGLAVTLTTDAALPSVVAGDAADGDGDAAGGDGDPPDAALVGADAVLADGDVVNKVGTRALGLSCRREGVPLFVAAARDKVAPHERFAPESAPATDLYEGEAALAVHNPRFDRTPADCVEAVVTEDGPLDVGAVRAVADDHREHARWVEDWPGE